MFSSNQQLQISCDDNQLESVLDFVMRFHQAAHTKLCWQETDDHRLAIGWFACNDPETGWHRFIFDDPSIGLLTETIKQFCEKYPDNSPEEYDGGYQQGFLIKALPEHMGDEYDGIQSPFYGIISIQAYKLFYAK